MLTRLSGKPPTAGILLSGLFVLLQVLDHLDSMGNDLNQIAKLRVLLKKSLPNFIKDGEILLLQRRGILYGLGTIRDNLQCFGIVETVDLGLSARYRKKFPKPQVGRKSPKQSSMSQDWGDPRTGRGASQRRHATGVKSPFCGGVSGGAADRRGGSRKLKTKSEKRIQHAKVWQTNPDTCNLKQNSPPVEGRPSVEILVDADGKTRGLNCKLR
jgi:hypothetical protein